MKTLQSLVESNLPVEKVVEVTLPLTRRAKPEYKGNAHVKLRVDFARGNGWSGIATVNGREIKITGPYGEQSKVPGLTVPAGTGRGEWEWKAVNEQQFSKMDAQMHPSVKAVYEFMQKNLPADELVLVASAINTIAPAAWGHHPQSQEDFIPLLMFGEYEQPNTTEDISRRCRNALIEQSTSPFRFQQFVDSIVEEYILLDKMVFDKECSPQMWEQAWIARQALGWVVDRGNVGSPLQSILKATVPQVTTNHNH